MDQNLAIKFSSKQVQWKIVTKKLEICYVQINLYLALQFYLR